MPVSAVSLKYRSKSTILVALCVVLAGIGAMVYWAASPSQAVPHGPNNVTDEGVAISGYDTVAYFTEGQPIEGKADINYRWQDALWYFSNEKHRDMFIANPDGYAPEFGGFCAAGMTYGAIIKADPEVWAIVDGKLYLNYDDYSQEVFHENRLDNVDKAEQQWELKLEAHDQDLSQAH